MGPRNAAGVDPRWQLNASVLPGRDRQGDAFLLHALGEEWWSPPPELLGARPLDEGGLEVQSLPQDQLACSFWLGVRFAHERITSSDCLLRGELAGDRRVLRS